MIKYNWNVTHEERERIIKLHESATKNLYIIKEQDENESIYYKIGATNLIIKGGKLYSASFDRKTGVYVPIEELSIAPSLRIESGSVVDNDESSRQSSLLGPATDRSSQAETPMKQQYDLIQPIPYVTMGYQGTNKVPQLVFITVRESKKIPENHEVSEDGVMTLNKTCIKINNKKYYYLYAYPSIFGTPVGGSANKGETKTLYFCLTSDRGLKFVVSDNFKEGESTDPKLQIGLEYTNKGKIVNSTGPYNTTEEAQSNCGQTVEVPNVIPFEESFANNISNPDVTKPSIANAINNLRQYLKSGGKIKSLKIVASASRVPAGSVENNPSNGKWKDNKNYDNQVKGNNDDKTGNLQLTKARAYNLYLKLLELIPELKNIPIELEGLGSQGDAWDNVDANAEKYRRHRKVNLIINR